MISEVVQKAYDRSSRWTHDCALRRRLLGRKDRATLGEPQTDCAWRTYRRTRAPCTALWERRRLLGGNRVVGAVGDLVGLEAHRVGLAGIVIWGLHRDNAELREIGIPLFSLGTNPCAPQRLDEYSSDALASARVGDWTAAATDVIVADDDGVIALPSSNLVTIARAARKINETEIEHARLMRDGMSFRNQVGFTDFLEGRAKDAMLTFRKHLRARSGSIEE